MMTPRYTLRKSIEEERSRYKWVGLNILLLIVNTSLLFWYSREQRYVMVATALVGILTGGVAMAKLHQEQSHLRLEIEDHLNALNAR